MHLTPKLSGAAPHHSVHRGWRQTGHFMHGASAQTNVRRVHHSFHDITSPEPRNFTGVSL
jgi:hypothetical protein